MTPKPENLSDTRGNHLGIRFFHLAFRFLGLGFCRAFVRIVALFYAIADRRAFRAATPYLTSRFPTAGPLARRIHFYRLIVSQGHAILLAHAVSQGRTVPFRDLGTEYRDQFVEQRNQGIIVLLSHIGCWQAAVRRLDLLAADAHFLVQENLNEHLNRFFDGKHLYIIPNHAPFGGLLDALDALEKKHMLCVMGDRLPAGHTSRLRLTLRGRTFPVPESPWLLAARTHRPVFIVFPMMGPDGRSIDFHFHPPVTVPYDLPRKPSAEQLRDAVRPYADALEEQIRQHPYQIFHYDLREDTP